MIKIDVDNIFKKSYAGTDEMYDMETKQSNKWKKWTSIKQKRSLIITLLLLISITILPISIKKIQDVRNRAASPIEEQVVKRKREFVPGEILIKIRTSDISAIELNQKAISLGKNLDKQSVRVEDLDLSAIPSSVGTLLIKNNIKTIEKVFKGSKSPDEELQKTKRQLARELTTGKRVINEKKLLQTQLDTIFKLSFDPSYSTETILNDFKKNSDIVYAQPNYIIKADIIPNDPYYLSVGSWGQSYPDLYGIKKINPASAWDSTTGSDSVVVGVLDTGIDYNHPDLSDNIWNNNNEVSDNGVDDDNNGYIDDVRGWNFNGGTNDPIDDNGHGTHVAGTIGAAGNNSEGVVGVAWDVKLMPLKFLGNDGNGWTDAAVEAIRYAADNGVHILSNSWGGYCDDLALQEVFEYAYAKGMVIVASAGNNAGDALDKAPACFDTVITVGATDHRDKFADFSNTGEKIDVVAPGVEILSARTTYGSIPTPTLITKATPTPTFFPKPSEIFPTKTPIPTQYKPPTGTIQPSVSVTTAITPTRFPTSIIPTESKVLGNASSDIMCTSDITVGVNYCRVSGTSMSVPHVSGLAALLLAKDPTLTNEQIRQLIRMGSTDLGPVGKDTTYGYGRIDASKTLSLISDKPLSPTIIQPRSKTTITGVTYTVKGTLGGEAVVNYKLELGFGRRPSSFKTVYTGGPTQPSADVLAELHMVDIQDGLYILRLTVTAKNGKQYSYQVNDILVRNYTADIVLPNMFVEKGVAAIQGTAKTGMNMPFGNYTLEWGEGIQPSSWSKTGILLTDNGTKQVTFGTLGTWDTRNLKENQEYTLRLTIFGGNGTKNEYRANVKIDPDLAPGWPKAFAPRYFPSYINEEHPWVPVMYTVFGDLNNDGINEIVSLSEQGILHVFTTDGNKYPNFPVGVTDNTFSFLVERAPTIADVTGDGKPEILLSLTQRRKEGFEVRTYSKILIIQANGEKMPGWPEHIVETGYTADTTPVVNDINNDGKNDIIIVEKVDELYNPASPAKIHVYQKDGLELTGFPIAIPDSTYHAQSYEAPMIADINMDGNVEIAWGNTQKLYLLDNTGKLLPGWPVQIPLQDELNTYHMQGFSTGDLNADQQLELYAFGCSGARSHATLFGWTYNGMSLPGYPKGTGETICRRGTPLIGDLDNDGKDDIATSEGGELRIYGEKGLKYSEIGYHEGSVLTDANKDDKLDIFTSMYIPSTTETSRQILKVFDINNTVHWQRSLPSVSDGYKYTGVINLFRYFTGSNTAKETYLVSSGMPAFADLSLQETYMYNMEQPLPYSYVFLWKLPKTGSSTRQLDWPIYRQNAARTSRIIMNNPIATLTPTLAPTKALNANYITNSSFEIDNNKDNYPDGWVKNVKASQTREKALDGIYSLKIESTDGSNNVVTQNITGITQNTVYVFTGNTMIPQNLGTTNLNFVIAWKNSSGKTLRKDLVQSYKDTFTSWLKFNKSYISPLDATNAQVRIEAINLKGTIFVDKLSLVRQ